MLAVNNNKEMYNFTRQLLLDSSYSYDDENDTIIDDNYSDNIKAIEDKIREHIENITSDVIVLEMMQSQLNRVAVALYQHVALSIELWVVYRSNRVYMPLDYHSSVFTDFKCALETTIDYAEGIPDEYFLEITGIYNYETLYDWIENNKYTGVNFDIDTNFEYVSINYLTLR